jgi:hypothetical protein
MLTLIGAGACCGLIEFGFRQVENTDVASIIPCTSKKRGVVHPDSNCQWVGLKMRFDRNLQLDTTIMGYLVQSQNIHRSRTWVHSRTMPDNTENRYRQTEFVITLSDVIALADRVV